MKGGVRLYITEQYIVKGGVKDGVSLDTTQQNIHEGWCETLHQITTDSWRVVWDFSWHNNTFMKGGVRLYITWQFIMKGGVRLYIT